MSFDPHEVCAFVRSNPTMAEALAQLPPQHAHRLTKVNHTTATAHPLHQRDAALSFEMHDH